MSDATLESIAKVFGLALVVLTLLLGAEGIYHLAVWIRDRFRWLKWFSFN